MSTTIAQAPPPVGPPPAPEPRVRASHAEREETVARLHRALGEGRLDLAETEERVAAAYAAQYRDDLPPLLDDLPGSGAGGQWQMSAAPSWHDVWVSAVWRARAALLGPAGAGGERPDDGQCRTAAVLAVLAMAWVVLWAFVGAAVVG